MDDITTIIARLKKDLAHLERLVSEEEKKPKKQLGTDAGFAEFWQAYPKGRVAKQQCLQKWRARNLDQIAEIIIADVKRRRIDDQRWLDGFVPNTTTYINQSRWESEIQTADRKSQHYRPKIQKPQKLERGDPKVAQEWLSKIKSGA